MALLVTGVVLLGTGCGAAGTVKMDDDRARMPELAASYAIRPHLTLRASANRTLGHNAEVGEMETGTDVRLGDVLIEEPWHLDGDFEVDRLALAVGIQLLDSPDLKVRVDGGMHRSEIRLTLVDEQGLRHHYDDREYGGQLGVHVTVPLIEPLSGELYGTRASYLDHDLGSSREQVWGLRLVFDAHERIKLFAGWRVSDVYRRSYQSSIRLDARGLNAGLALEF